MPNRLFRDNLLPLVGFLILALAYMYPLPLHWATAIPGDNGDGVSNLWSFWYFPWQLSQGYLSLHSAHQFAPDGVDLVYATTSIVGAVVMSPVAWVWSPAAALNTWLALHLWLGGWFFFKFCRTLEISPWGAWLAGCAYAWSPFLAAHMPGHYSLVQIGFTAAALWALAALGRRCAEWRYRHCVWIALGLAVSVWAVAISDFYLAMMTLFLLSALLLHLIIRYGAALWRDLRFPIYMLGAVAVTLVGLLPWINEIIAVRQMHVYSRGNPAMASHNVATWSRLVNLPAFHPIFGPRMHPEFAGKLSSLSEYAYLGVVALATAFIGVLYIRNWRRPLVWIAAFIVALGLAGQNRYSPSPAWPGGPLSFGKYWPAFFPFSEFRVPARWQFALVTSLAVLLGMGSQALLERVSRRGLRAVLGVCIMGLLLFDLTRWPMPMLDVKHPPTAVPPATPKDMRTVLDAPVGTTSGQGSNIGMYTGDTFLRQMEHHRPVISAYVSRIPKDLFDQRLADPELNAWISAQNGELDDSTSPSLEQAERLDWPGFRARYNIGVVRLDENDPTSETLKALANRMHAWKWSQHLNELIGE